MDRSLALARASYSLHWAHDYAGAREAVAEALACAREHGLAEAEAHALVVDRFSAATNDGNVDEFERAAEQLRDVAEDPALRAFALSHLGEAAEWRGDYPRAVELTEQALTLARSERLPDVMIYSAWFLGKANTCLGRYGLAVGQLGEALEIAERIGSRGWKTRLLNTLGWAYAEFGCHDRAARLNRESTDLGREMVELELVPGAPEIYGNAAINLAGNRLAAGDPDGAMEIIDPVRVSLETSDDPWMLWRYALHFRNALARVALARGDAELTLQLADEELTEARSIGVQKVVARALELRGRALATMDRRDEAGATLREALGVAEGIGYPPVVWRARGLLAELGRREGRTADAKEHATRARELVGSLAGGLPDDDLRSSLLALGERLATEPLAAGL